MALALILDVNQDFIQVYDKKIEFFGKNILDLTLESGWRVRKPKRHYLVLEMLIGSFESCFSFLIPFNSHPMIGADEI